MSRVLVTWIGSADLKAARENGASGLGPIAHAVGERTFDEVVLLSNFDRKESAAFKPWLEGRTNAAVTVQFEKLPTPMDYGAIYRVVSKTVGELRTKVGPRGKLTFHLSPGTPAMATVWILLSPRYGADLIQSSREAGVETVTIPFEIAAEFAPALVRQGDAALARLAAGDRPDEPKFADIVYRSEAMEEVLERARLAAVYNQPVLIDGESGTGKELLARAVHDASGRAGAFVPLNCGAIPRDLVESNFFGHTRGAFTGADKDREGAFEEANNGTLFLDEVGELPLDAQVKLLRVLQEMRVKRVGGKIEKKVDVRIVAATNRDLLAEVKAGRFREDLYFRLAVLLLRIPPLRQREGDLLPLVEHFLKKLNADRGTKAQKELSPAAKSLLLGHTWPGNVRELHATLVRAFVWSKGTTIDETAVRDALVLRTENGDGGALNRPLGNGFRIQDVVAEVIRHYLRRALAEAHGKKKKAATLVGLPSYQTLVNWAKRHEVEV